MARVLLLHNAPVLARDHPDAEAEWDLLRTVEAVRGVLAGGGHRVQTLALAKRPEELLSLLRSERPDLVFNLFEGLADQSQTEYFVAGLLDWVRIPYTGCPAEAMMLGRDKVRGKWLLRGAGLPTADFAVLQKAYAGELLPEFPVIVKPGGTDASVGIDQSSVAMNREEAESRIGVLLERYGAPVVVERYLPGTEFNVGVVQCPGLVALPVSEMVYTPQPGVQWPIVTYASKWVSGSADDLAMQPRCPARIDEGLSRELQDLAGRAFELFGCRDYARVDIRLDERGRPQILEVNPNPDLAPTAGLARMLRAGGWEYERFVLQLVGQRSM
jgi:D-alanine-D-alanine ligase